MIGRVSEEVYKGQRLYGPMIKMRCPWCVFDDSVFDEGVLIQVLGGVSEDLYRGEIFYSPIIKEMYYEVVISDIAVGGNSLQLDCKEVSSAS